MNGKLNVRTINNFDHALFFHLLTNDHFQGDFLNKLYISTFSNTSLPFHEVHLIEGPSFTTLLNHEKLFDVNQNLLARALKNRVFVRADILRPSFLHGFVVN